LTCSSRRSQDWPKGFDEQLRKNLQFEAICVSSGVERFTHADLFAALTCAQKPLEEPENIGVQPERDA
jgi:hypothetical protein